MTMTIAKPVTYALVDAIVRRRERRRCDPSMTRLQIIDELRACHYTGPVSYSKGRLLEILAGV